MILKPWEWGLGRMKASELINELQTLITEHGDLELFHYDGDSNRLYTDAPVMFEVYMRNYDQSTEVFFTKFGEEGSLELKKMIFI